METLKHFIEFVVNFIGVFLIIRLVEKDRVKDKSLLYGKDSLYYFSVLIFALILYGVRVN